MAALQMPSKDYCLKTHAAISSFDLYQLVGDIYNVYVTCTLTQFSQHFLCSRINQVTSTVLCKSHELPPLKK